jgi:hypothetical protein
MKWHSIINTLPEPGTEVLVFANGKRRVATYDEHGDEQWIRDDGMCPSLLDGGFAPTETHFRPTHWAALPEPPTTEEL